MSSSHKINVMMIEDNPGDARLIKEGLKNSTVIKDLIHFADGETALAELRSLERNEQPELIILDLNLPGMDGREVLKELKTNPAYKHIPVVILTSSNSVSDICTSYQLNANCFVSKPIELDSFMNIINEVERFWINIAKLPKDEQ